MEKESLYRQIVDAAREGGWVGSDDPTHPYYGAPFRLPKMEAAEAHALAAAEAAGLNLWAWAQPCPEQFMCAQDCALARDFGVDVHAEV